MRKTTLHPSGRPILEDLEPKHGKDFCYLCGKCLHCVKDEPCKGSERHGQPHMWLDNSLIYTRKTTLD